MKSALIRTGSFTVVPVSPRLSLSLSGKFSCDKTVPNSPRILSPKISCHFDAKKNWSTSLNRAYSDPDLTRSSSLTRLGGYGPEKGFGEAVENYGFAGKWMDLPEDEAVEDLNCFGEWHNSGVFAAELRVSESCDFGESWGGVFAEEMGLGGGRGIDGGTTYGGGGGGRGEYGSGDKKGIGKYYEEMLKEDPSNSLLLRNYGKFLHEVEKDVVKAEEYYGRAILACPGDGELLALYGKLIWEKERDEERARSYFNRAVTASPDDCMVLASFAQFLWEAEEDETESAMPVSAAMVEAF